MAKNWSMRQAVEAVLAGNKEDIIDIGKRFPLVLNAISSMGKNEGAIAIITSLPEHITARKIEAGLKDGVIESEEDEIKDPIEAVEKDEEVVEEKPVKKAKATKKSDKDDLKSMSEVELFKLCKSKGIKAKPKMSKNYYINLINAQVDPKDEDEEVAEEKPAKKAKPAAKKAPINKPEDLKENEEDEDDDWDI